MTSIVDSLKEELLKLFPRLSRSPSFKPHSNASLDDTDQAIEEFVKIIDLKPETVETYMALGNLFRVRGEVERAIKTHQAIISRTNIDDELKLVAKLNLALDYRKAGMIRRSIAAFENVLKENPEHLHAMENLEALYEETSDWESALGMHRKLSRLKKIKNKNVEAHLLTEIGKSLQRAGDSQGALKSLKKAISKDDTCIDAYLHMGDLFYADGKFKDALDCFRSVLGSNPSYGYLTYARIEKALERSGSDENLMAFVSKTLGQKPNGSDPRNIFSHFEMARHLNSCNDPEKALYELGRAIKLNPLFLQARSLRAKILLQMGLKDDAIKDLEMLIDIIPIPEKHFQCERCGLELEEITWKCPQCRNWDSFIIKSPPPEVEDR